MQILYITLQFYYIMYTSSKLLFLVDRHYLYFYFFFQTISLKYTPIIKIQQCIISRKNTNIQYNFNFDLELELLNRFVYCLENRIEI